MNSSMKVCKLELNAIPYCTVLPIMERYEDSGLKCGMNCIGPNYIKCYCAKLAGYLRHWHFIRFLCMLHGCLQVWLTFSKAGNLLVEEYCITITLFIKF